MQNETYSLGGNPNVTLTTYIRDAFDGTPRPIVIVCPGGGYLGCSPNEGEPVALRFMRAGYHAAVLIYTTASTAPGTPAHPRALEDLAEAMLIVRDHAAEWNVDADRVVLCGFSAGGHLCAQYGNLWRSELLVRCGEAGRRRPAALVLGYPVVDYHDLLGIDCGSAAAADGDVQMSQVLGAGDAVRLREFRRAANRAIVGEKTMTEGLASELSPIDHVGRDTPPTFLWTTFGDKLVDPSGDLRHAARLHKAGVPCELHVFMSGDHGLSLADATTAKHPQDARAHLAHWSELAIEWLGEVLGR